jgi:hypothetical protein
MSRLISHTVLFAPLLLAACGGAETAGTLDSTEQWGVERTSHVETHPSQGAQRTIDGAAATLAISDREVVTGLDTRGLTPGHVYTLWLVAINRPLQCATAPCKAPDILANTDSVLADVRWVAGGVADDAGSLSLTGRTPVGAWDAGWFGHGLTNPRGAEIHLVVNDHGPVIAGREQAMQTSYREGCTDESLPPPFPATAKADGTAGPNKCALVQDAIFVPSR